MEARVQSMPPAIQTEWTKRQIMDYALSLVREGRLSIDNEGHIWRHHNGKHSTPPYRAENTANKGYLRVTLGMPKTRKTVSVMAHRIVWEWFMGPIPDGLQINHINLNKQDNRLSNLEVVTQAANMQHSIAHGRTPSWALARQQPDATYRGRRLLTDADYIQIGQMRRAGILVQDVAKHFNCSTRYVYQVIAKRGGK